LNQIPAKLKITTAAIAIIGVALWFSVRHLPTDAAKYATPETLLAETKLHHVLRPIVACTDEGIFTDEQHAEEAVDLDIKRAAPNRLAENAECIILHKAQVVFLDSVRTPGTPVRVRVDGETRSYWTSEEAID